MNKCVEEVLKNIRGYYSEERYDNLKEMIIFANEAGDIDINTGLALLDIINYWRFYRRIVR